jgi:hypothetical protein
MNRSSSLVAIATLGILAGCDDRPAPMPDGGASMVDGGGPTADAGPDEDAGVIDPPEPDFEVETCGNTIPPTTDGACTVTPGDDGLLLEGTVLGVDTLYENGQVLVGADGLIACVGCDCAGEAPAATATRVSCASGVISPGLINAHDHLSFLGPPYVATAERYEHRTEWREGVNGHTRIRNGRTDANSDGREMRRDELRMVMAGVTSVIGPGDSSGERALVPGFVRNLDGNAAVRGGVSANIDNPTFIFGEFDRRPCSSRTAASTRGCRATRAPARATSPTSPKASRPPPATSSSACGTCRTSSSRAAPSCMAWP